MHMYMYVYVYVYVYMYMLIQCANAVGRLYKVLYSSRSKIYPLLPTLASALVNDYFS
jgi:hypothetical protein